APARGRARGPRHAPEARRGPRRANHRRARARRPGTGSHGADTNRGGQPRSARRVGVRDHGDQRLERRPRRRPRRASRDTGAGRRHPGSTRNAQRRLSTPDRWGHREHVHAERRTPMTATVVDALAPVATTIDGRVPPWHGFATLWLRRLQVTTKTASGIIGQLMTPVLWVLV